MTGIAISDTVTGPYKILRIFRPLAGFLPENISRDLVHTQVHPLASSYHFSGGDLPLPADSLLIFKRDLHNGQMCRDMTLFVDNDDKAYHIYASEENSTLHIAELSNDYLGHSGKYIRVFQDRFMEAPTLFKSQNKYYLIASGCTGWAPNAARSAWAPSIWGPWTEMGNPCKDKGAETTYDSQGTFVLEVKKNKQNAHIFMADRWNPDNPIDGRYVWLPIQFQKNRPIIEWNKKWDLSIFK